LTKGHSLALIHYIIKYITKPETSLHSKLTLSLAVTEALTRQHAGVGDRDRSLLIKTYNKVSSHREVEIAEMIASLLNLSVIFKTGSYQNIHTTHLLRFLIENSPAEDTEEGETMEPERSFSEEETENDPSAPCRTSLQKAIGDSEIVVVNHVFTIVAMFDDYANREESLCKYSLYDYCSLVYKKKRKNGLRFTDRHS
jgi:hypothetical protein